MFHQTLTATLLPLLALHQVAGQYHRTFLKPRGCSQSQQTRLGDKVTVHVDTIREGYLVSSTKSGSPVSFQLGTLGGRLDRGLVNICAGEEVLLTSDDPAEADYEVLVEVIMRVISQAPSQGQTNEICNPKKQVQKGDKVRLRTRTRIPNVIYLSYPHPTGNIPISVKQRGTPGTTVDHSVDVIKTGEGQLVPGWEAGIMGACEGEVRKIMMSPGMAFGRRGIHQKIPPNVPLALDVEIMDVEREERDVVLKFLEQGARGQLFNFAP